MDGNLTHRTSIPLTWVALLYLPTTSFVVGVALWVYGVDLRLERIEHRLGIDSHSASVNPIFKTAEAKEMGK